MSPATDTRLPSTSLAVVVGLTGVLVSLLLGVVPGGRLRWAGVAAGLALALSIWLADRDRWRAIATLLSSVLVVPVAFGLVAAGVGTAVPSVTSLPVATQSQLRPLVVESLARQLVVLGCATAAFGAAAATHGVLSVDRAELYAGVTLRTLLVPLFVGGVLFASGLVSVLESDAGLPGVDQLLGDGLGQVTGPLFAPAPGRTHLAVFCLLLTGALLVSRRALKALPLTELAPATRDGPDVDAVVRRVDRTLGWTTAAAGFLVPVLVAIESVAGQAAIARALPSPVYDLLVAITAAPALRLLLWRVLVAGAAVVAAVWFLRRAVQSSTERLATALAPYAGGAVITLAVLAVAGPVTTTAQTAIREAGPPLATELLDQVVAPVLEVFGAGTVALFLTVGVLAAAGGTAATLWLALVTGTLSERTAGAGVGAAGLFVASAFASPLGAPAPLVLAGLVGAVVVWDAGSFGSTLRRETGTGSDTRRAELVHTGGTVAVGGVGALLAMATTGVSRGSLVTTETAAAGLVVCLIAVVALIAALR